MASHQLRTPATGVKQYLGLLLQGYVGDVPDKQKQMITKAYDTNERELTIVEDLLKVAQVDADKVRLEQSEGDLDALIIDILDGFEEKAQPKKCNPDLTRCQSTKNHQYGHKTHADW